MGQSAKLKEVLNYIHATTDEMNAEEYVNFLAELFFELDEERRKIEWDGEAYEDYE